MAEGLPTFAILSDSLPDPYLTGRCTTKGTTFARQNPLYDVKNTLQVRQVSNLPNKRLAHTISLSPCSKPAVGCSTTITPHQSLLQDSCSEWKYCDCSQLEDYSEIKIRMDTECFSERDLIYIKKGIFSLQHNEYERELLHLSEYNLFDADDESFSYRPTQLDSYFLPLDYSLDQTYNSGDF